MTLTEARTRYPNKPDWFIRQLVGLDPNWAGLHPAESTASTAGRGATAILASLKPVAAKKRIRQKPRHEESKIQQAVIRWWTGEAPRHDLHEFLLFAIPNGGRRDKTTGAILKSEGVRAGVSDLFLAVPRKAYHGLFIEMKAEKGRVSPAQQLFLAETDRQGYAAFACYSYEQATKLISGYLAEEKFFRP